jgi:hypothetical protein
VVVRIFAPGFVGLAVSSPNTAGGAGAWSATVRREHGLANGCMPGGGGGLRAPRTRQKAEGPGHGAGVSCTASTAISRFHAPVSGARSSSSNTWFSSGED